jgi:hypothetical protein
MPTYESEVYEISVYEAQTPTIPGHGAPEFLLRRVSDGQGIVVSGETPLDMQSLIDIGEYSVQRLSEAAANNLIVMSSAMPDTPHLVAVVLGADVLVTMPAYNGEWNDPPGTQHLRIAINGSVAADYTGLPMSWTVTETTTINAPGAELVPVDGVQFRITGISPGSSVVVMRRVVSGNNRPSVWASITVQIPSAMQGDILGFGDDAPLLGFDDDAPLEGFA